jgi:hypothetical protein
MPWSILGAFSRNFAARSMGVGHNGILAGCDAARQFGASRFSSSKKFWTMRARNLAPSLPAGWPVGRAVPHSEREGRRQYASPRRRYYSALPPP